jgi:hypothetical protein
VAEAHATKSRVSAARTRDTEADHAELVDAARAGKIAAENPQ